MATKKDPEIGLPVAEAQAGQDAGQLNAAEAAATVKARVLVACAFGAPNEVVELPVAEAQAGQNAGQLDTSEAAVAYAMLLKSQD